MTGTGRRERLWLALGIALLLTAPSAAIAQPQTSYTYKFPRSSNRVGYWNNLAGCIYRYGEPYQNLTQLRPITVRLIGLTATVAGSIEVTVPPIPDFPLTLAGNNGDPSSCPPGGSAVGTKLTLPLTFVTGGPGFILRRFDSLRDVSPPLTFDFTSVAGMISCFATGDSCAYIDVNVYTTHGYIPDSSRGHRQVETFNAGICQSSGEIFLPCVATQTPTVEQVIRDAVEACRRADPSLSDLECARIALANILKLRDKDTSDEVNRDAEYKLRNWIGGRVWQYLLNYGYVDVSDPVQFYYDIFSNPAVTGVYNSWKWLLELGGASEWARADQDQPNSAPGGFTKAIEGWLNSGAPLDSLWNSAINPPPSSFPLSLPDLAALKPITLTPLGINLPRDVFALNTNGAMQWFDARFGGRQEYRISVGPNFQTVTVPAGAGYDDARFQVRLETGLIREFRAGEVVDFRTLGFQLGVSRFVLTGSTTGSATSYVVGLSFADVRPVAFSRQTSKVSPGDFDGDGEADITVFRPSTGIWYVRNVVTGLFDFYQWGLNGDIPVAGDYDGDGRADSAVWRPSTGIWYIRNSSDGASAFLQWGLTGDIPVPGDYDGDGKADAAVFRPSTGIWYVRDLATNAATFYQWGLSGDVPVSADYDGDGKTDVAVWRPSTGIWYILNSSNGATVFLQWGLTGDIAAPGDYDGDGKADSAVFRPSTGIWYVRDLVTNTALFYQWGLNGDVPVPGDFDGDGLTDVAVFRPSTSIWYVRPSSDPAAPGFYQWGVSGDIPILKRQ